uniref:palmitoyl-CoA hydrolase n=1 Tax=Eptatretus burgeri TaxID=7764 RepID=A0A8C4ND02_EPTBU
MHSPFSQCGKAFQGITMSEYSYFTREFIWSALFMVGLSITWGVSWTLAYKPVIIVHGLLDDPDNYATLAAFINQTYPGTKVIIVDAFNNNNSLQPMWKQVKGFREKMLPIMRSAQDGVNLICCSQGGLICRAILSTTEAHNVQTFISLAAPQMGQFGGDPKHQARYRQNNDFLAVLNNETNNPLADEWKHNFLQIQKLILIGGPDDEVISPWQSSFFSFYDTRGRVVDITQQEVYVQDSFGLQSLDRRNGLVVCTVPGVKHREWVHSKRAFDECIAKFLF